MFLADNYETGTPEVYREMCPLEGQGPAASQDHKPSNSRFLVRLARSLLYDLRRVIFPLSLFPKLVRVSDHDEEHDDIEGC